MGEDMTAATPGRGLEVAITGMVGKGFVAEPRAPSGADQHPKAGVEGTPSPVGPPLRVASLSPDQSPLSITVDSPVTFPKLPGEESPATYPKLPGEESPASHVCDSSYLAGSDCPSATPSSVEIQEAVKQNMVNIEHRFGSLLNNFSADLAQEVQREQKHLMLMQDQVDKQRETLTKQLNEVNKKLAEEEQQRVFVQQTVQDTNEQLMGILSVQSKELEILRRKVAELDRQKSNKPSGRASRRSTSEDHPLVEEGAVPRTSSWMGQLTSGVWSMFTVCSSSAGQHAQPRIPAAAMKDMERATLTRVLAEEDQQAAGPPGTEAATHPQQ